MNSYEIECPICDIKTIVEVDYEDEAPQHCPMCGEDVEPTDLTEE